MWSSLTLLCGIGLGFTLSHFPVLDGLMRFVGSCATSSLNGSLSSKSSWLRTYFDFFCFNSNLVNCPLVSFLRSFFSIFSIPILYGLVFKPFLGRVTISLFISILYGLVFKPFLGRVTIWSSLFISILYGPVFKPFLGRVAVFISICIYYSHISLSPFGRTSLKFK